jgi:hypothetical protein
MLNITLKIIFHIEENIRINTKELNINLRSATRAIGHHMYQNHEM